MKARRIKVRSSLYGWIKSGKFVSYPRSYDGKRDEAKVLTETVAYSAKKILGNGDLNPNFMEVLKKYQELFLNHEDFGKNYFESFFTKIGYLAIALVSSPDIVDCAPSLKNRCNVLIAVQFALDACANPEMLMSSNEIISKVDFNEIYLRNLKNSICRDLCKKLARNREKPEEFIIQLMAYYMDAYNKHVVNCIKKGLVPLN